ncbi:hypothetical protein PROPHIGD54-2_68 [Mycobacterium phage prophiGD54-2]|uniref:hypothetical protein n=1 Tax=Mycobacteroides abscessus TaxID=36809 RepID=UPI0019D2CEED|nr:hypothetical protein [Mycobacteroides abscessus]QSM04668.1 hypothetical protein PROPHIGD54-2_68 [Mycobacterium phage prophiGD54-2]QSN19633.1 hypothetical protein I3U41_17140 [Mycobacteroides abscessus subsp. abscessus]
MSEIVLRLVGKWPDEGWQDPETGEEFFNDTVLAEGYGQIGRFCVGHDDGGPVITAADEYMLTGKGLDPVLMAMDRITEIKSPFGFTILRCDAVNGYVEYRVIDKDVVWWDKPEEETNLRFCVRNFHDWTLTMDAPSQSQSYTDTKYMGEM